jgi:two-component system, OmpR family, response regulator
MRLLLAEDDPALGPGLKRNLEQSGFAVDLARNGVDAQALGDTEPYDAIVLDLGLPGRDGLHVLRHWRGRGNRVPVVILTARGAWQEKVAGFQAGADDYLAKPFHTQELMARIQAVVRRSAGRAEPVLQAGDLTLDEARQVLITPTLGEQALTGTEFRLLRYLMLHPGQVLSKSRLTEHVYDFDGDRDSNVIEVYVRRLREKIGADRIQTRRGQGYVFRAERNTG